MDIDDEGGSMYMDYSPEKMAEAIDHLINHPEVREEMGRALYRIRARHAWAERAGRVYRRVESLCQES